MYGIPRYTVITTTRRSTLRAEGKSLPRQGRPPSHDDRVDRRIIRYVRINPKTTYAQMRRALDILLSDDTLVRILDKVGLKHWRAASRPALTQELANIRLKWAKDHLGWTQEQRDAVIFSDECSVERGAGGLWPWVWRTPAQKWDKAMIVPHKKGNDISVMVWAAIWGLERSDLIIMSRDPEGEREGCTAASYIKDFSSLVGS